MGAKHFCKALCLQTGGAELELLATGNPGDTIQLGFSGPELCPGMSCEALCMLVMMAQWSSKSSHSGLPLYCSVWVDLTAFEC